MGRKSEGLSRNDSVGIGERARLGRSNRRPRRLVGRRWHSPNGGGNLKPSSAARGHSPKRARPPCSPSIAWFRLRTSFCILITYFCLLCSLSAAEERFELLKTYTKVPDSPLAKSFTLVTDEHQITFIPPRDALVQLHREKREVWMSFPDDRCLIKLQLSTNSPGMVSLDFCDQLRQLVQDRYPGAEVGPANFCYNSCAPGRSFDIQRPTASKMKLITRLAFVPFHDGMLEVSVSASDDKFRNAQFGLTWVLNSLRVEKPNPDRLALRKD